MAIDLKEYASLRLDDRLLEGLMILHIFVVTVSNALLVLILGEDRVRAAGQQHHSHQEWNDCFGGHVGDLVLEVEVAGSQ